MVVLKENSDEFNEELRDLLEYRLTLPDDNRHLFSFYEGYQRMIKVATRLISIFATNSGRLYPGKNVAVVSHSGSLRVLMRRFACLRHVSPCIRPKSTTLPALSWNQMGWNSRVTGTEGIELGGS